MRLFKGTWEANKSMFPLTFRGYQNGPAQWVDKAIAANQAAVAHATAKVDAHKLRMRQLAIEEDHAIRARAYAERARDGGGSAPTAILSFGDIVAMKPGVKGRHE